MNISKKIIHIISKLFFDIEKSLFKLIIFAIDFEKGDLGKVKLTIKEKKNDGSVIDRTIKSREEHLEIVYLPLNEFEEKYVGLKDEQGNEFENRDLITYRNKVHKTYEKVATRVVVVSIVGFTMSVVSNVLSNIIANYV